jgi:hypothetical protein
MTELSLRFPFKIGQPVRHRSDPTKGAGTVVGAILHEPVLALVDWQAATWTFEVLEDLVTRPRRTVSDAA